MGFWNNRAFCPECGGKIHTQGNGLGVLLPGASGRLVQTGTRCQHCGLALSGKVAMNNVAIAAADDQAKQDARAERREVRQDARAERRQDKAGLDKRLLQLLAAGPITFDEAAERLGVKRGDINAAQARLVTQVKAGGAGKKRSMRLRHPTSDRR